MGLPVDLIEKTDAYENELPVFPEGLILHKGEEISAWIDHTLLKPEATPAQITRLCQEAREHRLAAVCVNPVYVPLSVELLANSATAVCTVVGFPLGATLTSCKIGRAHV